MEYRLHSTCDDCTAYCPDHPGWPCCKLGRDIEDLHVPVEPCFKPGNEKEFAILALCRGGGESRVN